MKRLEKALAIGTFVIGIGLLGVGLYRDGKCPEEYLKNTLATGAGLTCLACSGGLFLREGYGNFW